MHGTQSWGEELHSEWQIVIRLVQIIHPKEYFRPYVEALTGQPPTVSLQLPLQQPVGKRTPQRAEKRFQPRGT